MQQLLDHLAVERPLFHLFLVLAATTGARRGQLLALRWADVDADHGSLSFQRSLVEGPNGPVLAPTKTRRSHRVALDPATVELLRRCREEARASLGGDLDDRFVFASDGDRRRPWKPNWVTKQFIAARRARGLDYLRLHDLRHFMATEMLAAGVAVPIVSARLADARASTTLNVYAHAVPGGDAHAVHYISRLVGLGSSPFAALSGRDSSTDRSGDVATQEVAVAAHRAWERTNVHDVAVDVGDLRDRPSGA
ncbi:MAG TPA: site-specific integrase [Acidimicrobiales bacterium]